MEVHFIDPVMDFPLNTKNQVRVLTVPHPQNSTRQITNVMCHFFIEGVEVSFQRLPLNSDDSFKDALNWAKTFALRRRDC